MQTSDVLEINNEIFSYAGLHAIELFMTLEFHGLRIPYRVPF